MGFTETMGEFREGERSAVGPSAQNERRMCIDLADGASGGPPIASQPRRLRSLLC